ncbi:MAG: Uma2 family endonuclease [Gemmataceae bacterium]|nr:Uma2 family endonuclease [Gemmataceae bacterium]
MSAVPEPRKLTAAEYLERERAATEKSEFYDGVMYAMAGASPAHNDAKDNLAGELHAQFKGGRCRANVSDQRVRTGPGGLYTYPDLVITCGTREYAADDPNTLTNPTAVVEVLSDGTESYDRGDKFLLYQRIASLREYVLVSQRGPVVERYVRQADGTWTYSAVVGLDAEFAFATAPARVRLADIYAGVTFPENPGSAPSPT